MKILLIGATGMIGSRIATEARRRGHAVTGATRSGTDGTITLDATDPTAVATAAAGQDAVIVAVRAGSMAGSPSDALLAVGSAVLTGLRQAGVHRCLVVGGAGSLLLADGSRFIDQFEHVPAPVKAEAEAQDGLLWLLRTEAGDLDWTYISPGGMIEPGMATGIFRIGGDQVMIDDQGQSRVSAEDYAAGLLDELEANAHIRTRINLAY